MIALFSAKPLISSDSAEWIMTCFDWIITQFDKRRFIEETSLILPNSEFFPDKANELHQMATHIGERVINYAGLSHWPFQLVPPTEFSAEPPLLLGLDCHSRSQVADSIKVMDLTSPNTSPALVLSYASSQMKKPEDFVAGFAHLVAQHYLLQSQQLPPGGQEYFVEATEVIAVFMGFGVMLANSAYTFRGGCSRCYDPAANRQAALSEHEVVYALALFCLLKEIPARQALKALKPYLRPAYKRAVKQIRVSDGFEVLRNKVAS